jgi:hypothetical protein
MRKLFLVVAGGNSSAQRHFEDTIKRRRTLQEVRRFLPSKEIENLERIYHGSDFIVWGAVPGPMNEARWEKMAPGDVVLIYNSGRICFAGEIAAKVRNKDLARYFWSEDDAGSTWELMYFIVNDEQTNVPVDKLNPLFGYQPQYRPQGFSMINESAVANFAESYGDILGALKTLERGEELLHVPVRRDVLNAHIDEQIERVSTEHDEMQWRLIRLGQLAKCDVWVPRNDQAKRYEGHEFREFVLREFHHTMDVPRSVENIDVVWKLGPYSIKSAFEIEHSTSVYSGILRLSDLRAEAPNSNYPLFVVASENRRKKVFDELRRPTFSGPCLRLNEVIKFLGYQKLREIDDVSKDATNFDANALIAAGEAVPLI